MSEAPGASDHSGSPARRKTTTGGESSPSRKQELDDSFLEERFVSLPGGSWESSQSFDSSRPSSRTSLRDQRKRFDLTTPTLMDEDDEVPDGDDDQEMVSLENRLRAHTMEDDEEVFLRRTPGASSMYKSSYDDSESVNMRRTPGASAMHRSGPDQEKDGASLGFALTLTTPVASEDSQQQRPSQQQQQDEQTGIWDKASPPDIIVDRNKSPDQKTRPPLAPAPATGPTDQSAAATTTPSEGREPFAFAPWIRTAEAGRAISPNTMRLRADLGNLLQDEDDDFAPEIPSAVRGDWTGSYVFDPSRGDDQQPPGVSRNYVSSVSKKEVKSRRRSQGNHQGSFLSHAQQPKPRQHSGNETFVFGQTRGDDRASPRLLNFGGAFAPPANNSGAFMRPVASSAIGGSNESSTASSSVAQAAGNTQGAFHAGLQTGRPVSTGFQGVQSFNIYQQGHVQEQSANVASAQQTTNRYSPSPPVHFVQAAQPQLFAHQPPSEMQATAREFVPMARSSTPQLTAQNWTQPYEGSLEHAASWHGGGARFVPTYGSYALPQQSFSDARSAMTPSPHVVSGWQPHDPNAYATVQTGHIEPQQYAQQVSNPTPTPSQHSQGSSEPLQREPQQQQQQQRKRETKRGKRGKKKSQREKNEFTSGKKTPIKKKGRGDGGRPGSTTQSQDWAPDEGAVSTTEDPIDAKRAELVESPSTRIAFKDFYRAFRGEERISSQKAEEYALQVIDEGSLPETVHWRVYLELADLAKRSNRFAEARQLYQRVCELQPCAFQGWLEYSKLEEECGNLNRVMNILHAGLEYCNNNETLMTRAVKLQEKMGNLDTARALLSRLKRVGIEKVWKTVLEGALLEARAGNVATARRVLKYLMHHVPWYGPLYLEAYRLERDQRNLDEALSVVKRGLSSIPRYGPLWFGAFRLCEEMDIANQQFLLPTAMTMIDRATGSISKELVWKVHLEAAQMYERAALHQKDVEDPSFDSLLDPSRRRFALTVLTCPNNLRWKVWLAAARTELGYGNTDRARAVFLRAHKVVPDKGRSATILECSRLEQFLGDTQFARAILCKGRLDYGHDWKVWLESVLLEIRDRKYARAIEICTGALEIHSGSGRLWACLVQLQQVGGGARAQITALRRALNAVPKSGEVWCEGGRIHLNPFSSTFDLDRARRHLYFATKFTPQYGDSFVEGIRLELLSQWLLPIATYIWEKTRSAFKAVKGERNDDRLTKYITDVALAISVARSVDSKAGPLKDLPKLSHENVVQTVRERLRSEELRSSTDLSDLRLACANADPNYGSLWFYCRRGPSDPPRRVIEYAAEHVAEDVLRHAHVYLAAMVRCKAVLSMVDLEKPSSLEGTIESSDPNAAEWEDRVQQQALACPNLQRMFNPVDPTTGLVLLDNTVSGSPLCWSDCSIKQTSASAFHDVGGTEEGSFRE